MLIKTRKELRENHTSIYTALYINRPDLLDKYYKKHNTALENKILLENKYFKKGIKPNKKLNKKHYMAYMRYSQKCTNSYDKNWINKMLKLYPFLKQKKTERSYKRLMSLMPNNVRFVKGQKWKGIDYKYWFVCSKYGKFRTTADSIFNSWKKGYSGHIKMGHEKLKAARSKKVKCLNNNIIYNSINELEKELKLSRRSIYKTLNKKQKHPKGYRFKYV